jgi:hypothetical protein
MDLSRTIYEATDPTVDPFKSLPHYINPHHLSEISMGTPQVLMIEKYSQNMLLSTTSFDNIFKLFKMVQTVGLETVWWIKEVKECCGMLGGQHSWIWPYSGIAKPMEFPNLRLLEGQGSIMAGADINLDSDFPPTRPSSPDYSKALILHPIYSNFACAHPEYNPFTSLNTIPDYPTYSDNNLSVNDLLDHLSIGMEPASMEWLRLGGLCYGYRIFVNIFSILFSLYLQVEKLNMILIKIPTQSLSWISSILFTLK